MNDHDPAPSSGQPGGDLRLATSRDVDAIRDLTREAYAKWIPAVGREPVPMTVDYAEALRLHRFDLLHRDGRLVAVVETIAHPDHLVVENLAVAPSWQGQGLGRRLLAHAERLAAELGHDEVRLLTNASFGWNVAFYQGAGYAIERQEPYRGSVTVHLRKRL